MSTWVPRRCLAELHHRPDLLGRADDRGPDVGLFDRLDRARVGQVGRAVDLLRLAVGEVDLVAHVRRRRQQVEVVLALQPLAHDLHVEEAEEAAAEAEPERLGGLRLPGERGVVEGELLERVAEVFVAVGVDREEAAEDHRPHLAVALQRLGRRAVAGGQGVADAQLGDVLDAGDQVADVAGLHPLDRRSSPAGRSRCRRCRPRSRSASPGSARACGRSRRPSARRRSRRGTGRTRSRRSAPAAAPRARPRAAGCGRRSPPAPRHPLPGLGRDPDRFARGRRRAGRRSLPRPAPARRRAGRPC